MVSLSLSLAKVHTIPGTFQPHPLARLNDF